MISTESKLKQDVREMTGYTSLQVMSGSGLDTAFRSARRHIRVEKGLEPDFDWYNTQKPARQDALFWYTCLFAKVQTGDLDSKAIQVGAIDENELLAKDHDSVTTWYRNAKTAMRALDGSSILRSTSPARGDREYEVGSYEEQDGGSSEVDASDL